MSMGTFIKLTPTVHKRLNIVPATPEILILLCYVSTKLASQPGTPRLLTLQYKLRHGLKILKPACGLSSPLAFIFLISDYQSQNMRTDLHFKNSIMGAQMELCLA